jgi:hypothetical protein
MLAALIGIILFLVGMSIGVLVGRRSGGRAAGPVVAHNEAGMGIRRDRMAELMSEEENGAFTLELTQGGSYDYYLGKSEKFDAVSIMLNGPPGELQQVGLVFNLKNMGRRVQLQTMLETIFKILDAKFNVTRLMSWIDQTTPEVAGTKMTATVLLGRYRVLLRDAGASDDEPRTMMMIEPAVRVTWQRD